MKFVMICKNIGLPKKLSEAFRTSFGTLNALYSRGLSAFLPQNLTRKQGFPE